MSEFRFFDYRQKDYPFHFWIIQFVVFLYVIIRLLSRDYSIYGEIPAEYFNYPRYLTNLYPSWLIEIFNTHWIYWFLKYPGSETLKLLQNLGVFMGLLGFFGILPKYCSIALFVLLSHLTGFIQATNAEIEGGTVLMVSLLVLSLSPNSCFYRISRKNSTERSNKNRWPVFLLFMLVGAFYTISGLNKILDVGPWWPFTLHLDNLSAHSLENSVFLSSRYVNFGFTALLDNYWFSVISGLLSLVGELGFITILFLPRYRFFFILNMIVLHILVYLSAGINFIGSSFILILCFDWNALFRRATVYYDADCGICQQTMDLISKLDFFKLIKITPAQNLDSDKLDKNRLMLEMGLQEQDGSVYYGADAFEIIFTKLPPFWLLALLYKIPGVIFIARFIYKKFAANRNRFGDKSCEV